MEMKKRKGVHGKEERERMKGIGERMKGTGENEDVGKEEKGG